MWDILLIIVQVLIITEAKEDDNCKTLKTGPCLTTYEFLMVNQLKNIKQTPEQLNVYCESISKNPCFNLIDEAEEPCKKDKAMSAISKSWKEFKMDLCEEDSDMQKLYLKKSACLNTNKALLDRCLGEPDNSKDKSGKCDIGSVIKCLDVKSVEKCGDDGREVVEAIMKPWSVLASQLCGSGYFTASVLLIIVSLLSTFAFY